MTNDLIYYNAAKQALATCANVDEVKDIKDKAEAIRLYAHQQKNEELEQYAAKIKARAMRRIGELSAELETHERIRTDLPATAGGQSKPQTKTQVLADAHISQTTALRCEKLAAMPEEKFDAAIERGETPTQMLKSLNVHVGNNSGENEWYTPSDIVEAVRATMGSIDLDPASSEVANAIVKASRYYTAADDGLTKTFSGRVFMNPPYESALIKPFCKALVDNFAGGEVTQAVVLVNNATETAWFQMLLGYASSVCFPAHRIRFLDPQGKPSGAPLQGQAILYFGNDPTEFILNFKEFGAILLNYGNIRDSTSLWKDGRIRDSRILEAARDECLAGVRKAG